MIKNDTKSIIDSLNKIRLKIMNLCEGLGFSRLSKNEQQAYKIILKAFSSMETSFDSSQIDRNVDLMKIIQVALGDNPNIIYFNKTQINVISSLFGKKIQLSGCPSKYKIITMNSELENKTSSIIKSIRKTGNDEYGYLVKIYEYIQNTVKYDREELLNGLKGQSIRPLSHNAYGALLNGLAVCDGFSSAFALLSQKLGFDCMLAAGRSTHRSAGSVEHAWNIIKCRNRCYHMDVTWDTSQYNEYGVFSYDYFALDDEEIANDHDWDISTTPACSYNDFSYYLKNGLYANNTSQLNDFFRMSGKKRNIPVRIKLSNNIVLPGNAGEHLAQLLLNEAVKAGSSAQLNYGWNEHTRCFFAQFMS